MSSHFYMTIPLSLWPSLRLPRVQCNTTCVSHFPGPGRQSGLQRFLPLLPHRCRFLHTGTRDETWQLRQRDRGECQTPPTQMMTRVFIWTMARHCTNWCRYCTWLHLLWQHDWAFQYTLRAWGHISVLHDRLENHYPTKGYTTRYSMPKCEGPTYGKRLVLYSNKVLFYSNIATAHMWLLNNCVLKSQVKIAAIIFWVWLSNTRWNLAEGVCSGCRVLAHIPNVLWRGYGQSGFVEIKLKRHSLHFPPCAYGHQNSFTHCVLFLVTSPQSLMLLIMPSFSPFI